MTSTSSGRSTYRKTVCRKTPRKRQTQNERTIQKIGNGKRTSGKTSREKIVTFRIIGVSSYAVYSEFESLHRYVGNGIRGI